MKFHSQKFSFIKIRTQRIRDNTVFHSSHKHKTPNSKIVQLGSRYRDKSGIACYCKGFDKGDI